MTKDQLNEFIRQAVLKEVREAVPVIVRDVMSKMLMEAAVSNHTPINEQRRGNSHKRQALQEASYGNIDELEDYPTAPRANIDRGRLASLMGYGDMVPGRGRAGDLIVSEAVTEHGTAIPVDPNEMPEHLVRALTRNYKDVLDAMNKKNG